MTAPTLLEIAVMDEVIPDLRCLCLAFEMRSREYAAAALIASKAWNEFGDAVDDGKPGTEINHLGDIAEEADKLVRQAYAELDAAKAALIAREQ